MNTNRNWKRFQGFQEPLNYPRNPMKTALERFLTIIATTLALVVSLGICHAASEESFTTEDYYLVDKIDVHFHILTEDPQFVTMAKRDRFRFVNIVTDSADPTELNLRHRAAFAQLKAHPDRIIVASSFSMVGWDAPDWADRTIRHLDETFAKGAVAVKVWKNIAIEENRERWLNDWRYFATKDDVRVPQFPDPVRGLQLPKTVVEKIYRLNAERFFDHAWKE